MTIHRIVNWFKKAVPEPNNQNFNTQLGCHVEEFIEMMSDVSVSVGELEEYNDVLSRLHTLAQKLKNGKMDAHVPVENRANFLKEICDQFVTGAGLAYYDGMDVESGLEEVAASNESKFDVDGNPIFDENKKIIKGPHYWKPDLRSFV